jgi:hypothetical protein
MDTHPSKETGIAVMLLLDSLDVAMPMCSLSLGVEAANKLEVISRRQLLLAFDDDNLIGVNGISQLRKSLIINLVQINSLDDGAKLDTRSQ